MADFGYVQAKMFDHAIWFEINKHVVGLNV